MKKMHNFGKFLKEEIVYARPSLHTYLIENVTENI